MIAVFRYICHASRGDRLVMRKYRSMRALRVFWNSSGPMYLIFGGVDRLRLAVAAGAFIGRGNLARARQRATAAAEVHKSAGGASQRGRQIRPERRPTVKRQAHG